MLGLTPGTCGLSPPYSVQSGRKYVSSLESWMRLDVRANLALQEAAHAVVMVSPLQLKGPKQARIISRV